MEAVPLVVKKDISLLLNSIEQREMIVKAIWNEPISAPIQKDTELGKLSNIEKLVKDQIPLTVCPLSNVKLCVFDKLENHNLKKMLDKGLRVMVNSDDPAYFGGYLNKNLIETSKALNLELLDVKKLIENSFKSSFLNDEDKKKWLKKIN